MYLARKLTGASYPQIGEAFHRDHSTVIEAVRKIEWLKNDSFSTVAGDLEILQDKLGVYMPIRVLVQPSYPVFQREPARA